MGEKKNLQGKSKFGIKVYQSLSEIIKIKQTYFLNKFQYLFFYKTLQGFPLLKMWRKNTGKSFKKPAGFKKTHRVLKNAFFFTLTTIFTMIEFLFLGLNANVFTNLSL